MSKDKKILCKWALWFCLANAMLFWLIGLNYLPDIPWLDTHYLNSRGMAPLKLFMVFVGIGHLGLLALIELVFLIPIILIFSNRHLIFFISSLFATVFTTLLIADVFIYKLYHFHLNGVVTTFITHGLGEEMFGLAWTEYMSVFIVMLILFGLQGLLALLIWRFRTTNLFQQHSHWLVIVIGLALYSSYYIILHVEGKTGIRRVYVDAARTLPLYTEILGALLPMKNGESAIEKSTEGFLLQPNQINRPLEYPLKKLQFGRQPSPLNLIIIVIDTWRFDMLRKDIMPNVEKFAESAWVFKSHMSGGNSTGPGVFSIFYGLPSTYWTAMEMQHQSPVLIQELQKRKYQIGIFSSAELRLPPFHKTIFQAIPNLQIKEQAAANSHLRDQMATQKFNQFIKKVSAKQPFFGFLFYDGVHSYCTYPEDLLPRTPAVKNCRRMELTNQSDPEPYKNRYKNAVYLVDQQVKQVLAELKKRDLLKNTVVVITGDHGEEFNDNHMNYWGHASNFTQFQTRTPLIVYWPGSQPKTVSHLTNHFDIVPTLMKGLFKCKNPAENYSLGKDLIDSQLRPYLIVGGYDAFGIVDGKQITHIYRGGNLRLQELNGKNSTNLRLNESIMRSAFLDLRRFYK